MTRAVRVVSELKATNWILERWAASVGDGLYDAPWEDVPRSRVLPLNDHMAIVVDQMVMRSGDKTKKLIGYWYRTSLPKTVIAQRIGVDRDTIYTRWNAALWYFRWRFLECPNSDLRLIARTDLHDVGQVPTEGQTGLASDSPQDYTPGANIKSCRQNLPTRRRA